MVAGRDEPGVRDPLLTVVIPTYNRSILLSRAIESVLVQTYPHLEVLIADNASTDETEEICRSYVAADARVRYVRRETNIGMARNFTEGMREADGQYCMWLADDDYLGSPEYLTTCYGFLRSHPDHVLVCGVCRYERDGQILDEERLCLQSERRFVRVCRYAGGARRNGVAYGLARRDLLTLFDLRDTVAWDWLMLSAIAYRGKIAMLDGVSLVRSDDGVSGDFESLATYLGLEGWERQWLFAAIGLRLTKAILRQADYRETPLPGRVLLAGSAGVAVARRDVWPRARNHLRQVLRPRTRWRALRSRL